MFAHILCCVVCLNVLLTVTHLQFPIQACFSATVTHRRSIAERGGCFQRRLSVSLLVCQHDNLRTIKRGMMKLGS